MHYSEAQFSRLVDAIEEQGGRYRPETHDSAYHTKLTGNKAAGAASKACEEVALVDIPVGLESEITACLICDRVGLWPRFLHANAKGTD